jgi:cell wall-associated protein
MGGEGEPSRPRSINTRLQRFYQRSIVEQDSLGRAVSLREYTDRRIQTDRNFRAPASYYQAFGPNVATYQSSYAYAQQQAERARAQAEQRRRQQIRYEYGLATGQNSSPTIREGLNLYRNWNTSLQNTLKHVCTTAERVKSQVVDFVKNVDWKKVAVTAAAIGVGIALTVATGGLGAPVAMAIGGAASGAIISGYDAYSSGQRGWELVGSIAKGAGTGAISGLIGGQFVGAGASLATNVTQSISNQAVRQVAKIGVESAVETAIDTGIDLATGNKITGQTVAMNFAFNTFTNGAGSVSPKKAPKADVVTTKPTGGRLPMTVDNLQMFAEKSGASVSKARYGKSKLSAAEYKKLRDNTPTPDLRMRVNEGISLPMNDFAIPGNVITKKLEADHIVPMKKIVTMEGFDKLSSEQQLSVLNFEENFIGLSKSANTSKGAKSYSDWTMYKKTNTPINPIFREEMIRKEAILEGKLQSMIDNFIYDK